MEVAREIKDSQGGRNAATSLDFYHHRRHGTDRYDPTPIESLTVTPKHGLFRVP
jgi:hypothetical protein